MTDSVPQKSTCPIDQMTFGEISRYVQGGYSRAIQQAINVHVDLCNHCRAELERFHSLQGAGLHIMETHVIVHGDERDDGPSDGGLFLNENALAAYVDGTLSGDERSAFAQRIASSQSAYHHFSSVKSDLANPPRSDMLTPEHVLAALKKPVPVESLSLADRLSAVLNSARDGLDTLLELKWPAPALAFALGLLVMLVVTPGSTTIMRLPPIADTEAGSDHLLMGDSAELSETEPVLWLPAKVGGGVEFYWAQVTGESVTYKVAIYNESGDLVYQAEKLSNTSVRVKSTLFRTGSVYAVVVTAVYQDGSMRPVSSQRVART